MARILVLDDNSLTLKMVSAFFDESPHQVVCAANGKEGLFYLENDTFDLVITDMFMPEIGGLEIIKWIRTNRPQTQIIAVSAGVESGNADYLREALLHGADDILSKPLDRDSVLQFTDRMLANSPIHPSFQPIHPILLILDPEKTVLRTMRHHFNASPYSSHLRIETRNLALGLSRRSDLQNIGGCIVDITLLEELKQEWNAFLTKQLPPLVICHGGEVPAHIELGYPSIVAYLKKPITEDSVHHALEQLFGA